MGNIKFRQPIFNRDGSFKEWHYWGIGISEAVMDMPMTFSLGITNPKESQQNTGMHDKNGTPIYEGDVLLTDSGALQKVKYREDMAQFVCSFRSGASTCIQSAWEVVGNIMEHPNLIIT